MAFPTNLDSFSTKTSGQVVAESHVNDVQTAIVATETKIGYGADTPVSGDFFKGTGTGTSGWSALASSDLPAGVVVQVVNTIDGAVATGSTAGFPEDDTIPQITEGDQFMSRTITPLSATNKLKIEVVVAMVANSASGNTVVALHQDAIANALSAVKTQYSAVGSNNWALIVFTHYMVAGTTSEITFRVRIGSFGGGTTTFNGSGGARKFGGVLPSSITVTEIKV